MAKIPYLFRRKNIYYFRIRISAECQNSLKAREIIQSLKNRKPGRGYSPSVKTCRTFQSDFTRFKNRQSSANKSLGFIRIRKLTAHCPICSSKIIRIFFDAHHFKFLEAIRPEQQSQ